jgi:ATP-dependent protease ClpP protease subunit
VSIITLYSRITECSVNALIEQCHTLYSNGDTSITINVASSGGCIKSAIRAYDILSSFPAMIHTHSFGRLDSTSSMLFLAGNVRSVEPQSIFSFQLPSVILNKDCTFRLSDAKQLLAQMENDFDYMLSIFRTCASNIEDNFNWNELFNSQSVWNATSALSNGLVDFIGQDSTFQDRKNIVAI